MKIEILVSMAGRSHDYQPGDIVDLLPLVAEGLVERGLATRVAVAEPPPARPRRAA